MLTSVRVPHARMWGRVLTTIPYGAGASLCRSFHEPTSPPSRRPAWTARAARLPKFWANLATDQRNSTTVLCYRHPIGGHRLLVAAEGLLGRLLNAYAGRNGERAFRDRRASTRLPISSLPKRFRSEKFKLTTTEDLHGVTNHEHGTKRDLE